MLRNVVRCSSPRLVSKGEQMTEKTPRGVIYVMESRTKRVCKIGRSTTASLRERWTALSREGYGRGESHVMDLEPRFAMEVDDAESAELALHRAFSFCQVKEGYSKRSSELFSIEFESIRGLLHLLEGRIIFPEVEEGQRAKPIRLPLRPIYRADNRHPERSRKIVRLTEELKGSLDGNTAHLLLLGEYVDGWSELFDEIDAPHDLDLGRFADFLFEECINFRSNDEGAYFELFGRKDEDFSRTRYLAAAICQAERLNLPWQTLSNARRRHKAELNKPA